LTIGIGTPFMHEYKEFKTIIEKLPKLLIFKALSRSDASNKNYRFRIYSKGLITRTELGAYRGAKYVTVWEIPDWKKKFKKVDNETRI
jgi:hypothetical protein